jgi:hypothetical protein
VHLSSPPTQHITLTKPCDSSYPQKITPGNSSHSYYTNNTVPSRKDTSKTMPTKKAPRKETGRLRKKSSVATSAAASKRDPAITVPPPPPKKGQNNKTAPSSSLRNQRYASCTQTVSSNPTSGSTDAIGVGTSSPLPSEQVVTRLC